MDKLDISDWDVELHPPTKLEKEISCECGMFGYMHILAVVSDPESAEVLLSCPRCKRIHQLHDVPLNELPASHR